MSVLEADSVSRTYAQSTARVNALRPVSLRVEAGEFLAVTGPSGSGKSTLLNLLSGLDTPSGGAVRFDGRTLSSLQEPDLAILRNRSFGFIFQTPHVLPYKTVAENVALPFHYGGRSTDRKQIKRRVESLLEYVGLAAQKDRSPSTLSGGELQRVVFARAMVGEPGVIFADEPTGSLDAENSKRLLELLKEQASLGKMVIMASHDRTAVSYATGHCVLDKFNRVATQ